MTQQRQMPRERFYAERSYSDWRVRDRLCILPELILKTGPDAVEVVKAMNFYEQFKKLKNLGRGPRDGGVDPMTPPARDLYQPQQG